MRLTICLEDGRNLFKCQVVGRLLVLQQWVAVQGDHPLRLLLVGTQCGRVSLCRLDRRMMGPRRAGAAVPRDHAGHCDAPARRKTKKKPVSYFLCYLSPFALAV